MEPQESGGPFPPHAEIKGLLQHQSRPPISGTMDLLENANHGGVRVAGGPVQMRGLDRLADFHRRKFSHIHLNAPGRGPGEPLLQGRKNHPFDTAVPKNGNQPG